MEISGGDDAKQSPREDKRAGGLKAAVFVYATGGLENMAFVANAVSLVTYFAGYMNFGLTKSSNTLTTFMGTSFILALLGGVVADTCLTKFTTCVLFGFLEVLISTSTSNLPVVLRR
ncbi:hypothetical protein V6N13_120345 [Hibiscus sabdariffa]